MSPVDLRVWVKRVDVLFFEVKDYEILGEQVSTRNSILPSRTKTSYRVVTGEGTFFEGNINK